MRLRRLIHIDVFLPLAFNVLAFVGTLILSILAVFVPLALVIAGVNVAILSVVLLVRLGALTKLIDHMRE